MKTLVMKIIQRIPAITAIVSIVFATFIIYNATLAINNKIKNDGVLPTPTRIMIPFVQYHVITGISFIAVITIVLIEWKNKAIQTNFVIELIIVSMFLILTACTFLAMSLPFICMCYEWRQW